MDPRRRVEETWEGKLSYSSRGARLVVVDVQYPSSTRSSVG
ncbi:hypothetical protein FOQG_06608 [Fusarium oxysporum f. sp. raphani 54005]|uniref:Uncharacterized protein n=6 Tax=Fusarium oxysporum TaxID=5507 RepID=W9IEN5_FUSOX|nr:uncharacterized protein FOXG_22982 [Fusarium oxysporum f. sp. lycopersici 4287]EWY90941.1 hypothetical protein FOYG_08262 [Fusarium oxysporum NRRL 32931]EWZ89774.1 hypothetical protein FOWG_07677 [Fusarium oxysporum f. sp. lycopersici MN25]EXK39613.1 hypothetical protein FOMG_06844 [Fusarium oxysporum f. sp. melonis 26406]EXK91102.1 hypothetical protein FOQG_06608 [Fusarium oxysporum f. sp. raphani 54005]EXL84724.1 hypothetical protein FOPG_03202 [Fusarium oxysporum f. sp. conglutinans race